MQHTNSNENLSTFDIAETHAFNVSIAMKYGIECATVFFHIHYLIVLNKKMNKNFFDGKHWTYQTRAQLSAAMPYFNHDQIRRYTDKLCEEGYLIKGNYNKSAFDKTIWYSLGDQQIQTTYKEVISDKLNNI